MPVRNDHDLPAYDAVIATRNRPEALRLSLPLLVAQDPPPARLIVIDSSDDHESIRAAVNEAAAGFDGEVVVEASEPGLPHQRNRGLTHVTAPVVLFPDDDSLVHEGAMAAILAVYARDADNRIAAVGAAAAEAPPSGVLTDKAWTMSANHRREARSQRLRNRVEDRFAALKPQRFLGRRLNARHPVPEWLAEHDAVPVDYITGFRMSFRTAAIASTGFDEALEGYALDEDIDASFQAMRHGLVVATRRARIYHHRFPSGRGDGARLGRMEVLNRVYLGLKHASETDLPEDTRRRVRHLLRRFVALKIAAAVPGVRSAYGRARLAGALSAWRASGPIWTAEAADLTRAYRAAMARAAGT